MKPFAGALAVLMRAGAARLARWRRVAVFSSLEGNGDVMRDLSKSGGRGMAMELASIGRASDCKRRRKVLGIAVCVVGVAGMSSLTQGAPGDVYNLGTLGGTFLSEGHAINAGGQVAGFSYTAGYAQEHGFIYYSGTPGGGDIGDLNTLGGTGSEAYGINGAGQVV